MKNKKLILFDLDGVILDSKTNMMFSWAAVQEKFSIATPFENYFQNIGRPFYEIMEILGHSNLASEIEPVYKASSIQNIDKLSFYDDVEEVLSELISRGYKLGVVTSKDNQRTKLILDKLNIEFSIIRTPDSLCRGKPAPDHLLLSLALTNTDPADAVYIGDMDVDCMAAERAGINYLHATWGYSSSMNENIHTLQSFKEITDVFEEIKI